MSSTQMSCHITTMQYTLLQSHALRKEWTQTQVIHKALTEAYLKDEHEVKMWASPQRGVVYRASVEAPLKQELEARASKASVHPADALYSAIVWYLEYRVQLTIVSLVCQPKTLEYLGQYPEDVFEHALRGVLDGSCEETEGCAPCEEDREEAVQGIEVNVVVSKALFETLPADLTRRSAMVERALKAHVASHPLETSEEYKCTTIQVNALHHKAIRLLLAYEWVSTPTAFYERAVTWYLARQSYGWLPQHYQAKPWPAQEGENAWRKLPVKVSAHLHHMVCRMAARDMQTYRTIYYNALTAYLEEVLIQDDTVPKEVSALLN